MINSTSFVRLSNADLLATTSSINDAPIAIQQEPTSKNRIAPKKLVIMSSLHQISHNDYEIKTRHVIQNSNIQQVQNYPGKNGNSAKMLVVILPSHEQRVITFTLPRESCTVQDLLKQVGVPFDYDTTIKCVDTPGGRNDFVVTVGSQDEDYIQIIRHPETTQKGLTEDKLAREPTPAERFLMPSNITYVDKDERKLIYGFLAVCPNCGFCGQDHAKCERCTEVFIRKPKRIPNPHVVAAKAALAKAKAESKAHLAEVIARATALTAVKRRENKKPALSTGVCNPSQTKLLSTKCRAKTLVSSYVPNQSCRNKPSKVEPVKLIIDEQAIKRAHKIPVVKFVSIAANPVDLEPDATKVDISRIYAGTCRQIDVYQPKDIDSELLISSVKSRPALYDKNHIFYSDCQTKEMLWLEICEILVPQWNELNSAEKSQIEAQVQSQWQDCKTCFEKECNAQRDVESGQTVAKRIKYEFFDQLLFLLPTINTSPTSSNLNRDNTDPVERDGEQPQKAEALADFAHPPQQSKSYEERILQVLEDASKENVDEDTHFMLSLVPSLQRCSHAQKLKVKMKFLQTMADVENEAPQKSITHSSSNSSVPENWNVPIYLNQKQYSSCSKSPGAPQNSVSRTSIYPTDRMGLRIVESDATEESTDEEVLH